MAEFFLLTLTHLATAGAAFWIGYRLGRNSKESIKRALSERLDVLKANVENRA